ncbi:LacI family DNA-binding transcriptional regulator [Streptomyces sp. Tu 2975]|uniref:LacI family DNA-binding transcriptional regulator n=1 Tax=Streptomyces sp. Tu 2975 TaxID=2676871 RepID=UPI0013568547|nr:LacI family DNA-binding transcriptional regulator [Streptomyces sp. Tu 2975]QIP87595.1 LacI family DNA-binding transcriptional regulator [Streptomyces sp. Tu 2975]
MTTARELPAHGTYARARGNHRSGAQRCRCYPCRAAEGAYAKRRKYLQASGRPLLADAAPIAAHLKRLTAAGDSLTVIADQIGYSRSTLANIVSGRTRRVRSALADKILAIRPGKAMASNKSVPAIGSVRRLRALAALGHYLKDIAAAAGIDQSTASYVLNGHPETVQYDLALRIDRGYRQLGTRRGGSIRILRRAEREQWAPPAAWDDDQIDDPNGTPDAGDSAEMNRDELAEYRRQEIAHLAAFNVPEHEIAQRLGMSPHYVHDLIRDRLTEAA